MSAEMSWTFGGGVGARGGASSQKHSPLMPTESRRAFVSTSKVDETVMLL